MASQHLVWGPVWLRLKSNKMATVNTSASTSRFDEWHSAMIRIWHWTFFLLLMSTITLVLFATQIFDTRANAPMVMEEAAGRGAELTEQQSRGIAHGFSEKLWVLHTYVGYGIAFLILSRMVIEVLVSKEERLLRKLKTALKFAPADAPQKQDRLHYLFVKFGYLAFYALVLLMACTGLGLAFEEVPIFDEWHRPIKQIHELGQYGIYAYIVLHLIGVIRMDIKHKGLISGMVGGR
jgi:Ni/Fe-hydrogenase 1 B-type cytochrome subunit